MRSTARALSTRLARAVAASALVLPLAVATAPLPVSAAPTTIYGYTSTGAYGTSNYWSPSSTTIMVGDTQQWAINSGTHTLATDSSGTPWPSSCSGGALPASCRFAAAGTYNFHCGVHGGTMSGSVTVTGSAPNPTPPPPSPTPAPPHPTANPTHSNPPAVHLTPASPATVAPLASPPPVASALAASASPSEVALNQTQGAAPLRGASGSGANGAAGWVVPAVLLAILVAGGGGAFLYIRRLH